MYHFLSCKNVIAINWQLVKEFGGLYGIRDKNLLESAVYAPQATFDGKYLYQTIHEIAAAYAYYIIKDHPFVDGNKRTGLMTAILFLESNQKIVIFKSGELYNLGIKIAKSEMTIKKVSHIFKQHMI